MSSPEPFLKSLSPLLFGPAPSRLAQAAGRLRRLSTIEELYALFGRLLPEARLCPAPTGATSRRRRLTAEVTFWAFLAQVLGANKSSRAIVTKLEAWWRFVQGPPPRPPAPRPTASSSSRKAGAQRLAGRAPRAHQQASVTESASCQARQRLPLEALRLIQHHLAFTLQQRVDPALEGWTKAKRRVLVVDGTTLTAPDTAANQQRWPQPSSQKPRLGFPLLKVVGLFCLSSGALLAHALGSERQHELTLFYGQLLAALKRGDVLLGDRGFCTFTLAASLLARGADGVFRLRGSRRALNLRFGKRLGPAERLVTWQKPPDCPSYLSAAEFAGLPTSWSMRLVRVSAAPVRGFRSRSLLLVTTLLDRETYPAAGLGALYLRRWQVELHFLQLKTMLGIEQLRCQSPEMVEKELQMHLIGYNLVRSLMQEAAHVHRVPLERLSFQGSLDVLRPYADAIYAASGRPRRQAALISGLLAALARQVVPARPARGGAPRAVKRRRKNYQLLTRPREKMGRLPHRNCRGRKAVRAKAGAKGPKRPV